VLLTQQRGLGDGLTRHSERHRGQGRAGQAKQKEDGTQREWCPVSHAIPASLRRSGGTETLT